jgi:hypothetical protein
MKSLCLGAAIALLASSRAFSQVPTPVPDAWSQFSRDTDVAACKDISDFSFFVVEGVMGDKAAAMKLMKDGRCVNIPPRTPLIVMYYAVPLGNPVAPPGPFSKNTLVAFNINSTKETLWMYAAFIEHVIRTADGQVRVEPITPGNANWMRNSRTKSP